MLSELAFGNGKYFPSKLDAKSLATCCSLFDVSINIEVRPFSFIVEAILSESLIAISLLGSPFSPKLLFPSDKRIKTGFMFLFFAESASLLASSRPRAKGVPPPPGSAPNFFSQRLVI